MARTLHVFCVMVSCMVWPAILSAQTHPVIDTGREDDVLALFAPFGLGSDVRGWRLENVRIGSESIEVELVQEGESAVVYLRHVGEPGTLHTPSFAISDEGADASRDARNAIIARVSENDGGDFWQVEASPPPPLALRVPRPPWWPTGLLVLALFVGLIGVSVRVAQDGKTRGILLAIVAGGIIVRLWLSPRTLLGAWFYSRTTHLQISVLQSHSLAWLNERSGAAWDEVDLLCAIGFGFAVVTPLAVFLHGRLLLGTPARGLLAAAFVAFLPTHIRFSMSEVAFIPSIVFSCSVFVAAHGVLKAKAWISWLSGLILVPLTMAMLYARPLNILFLFVLLIYLAFVAVDQSRIRRFFAFSVPAITAIPIVLTDFLARYGNEIREGTSMEVLKAGVLLVFDVENNTLINFALTPWPLLLCAILPFVFWWLWSTRRRSSAPEVPLHSAARVPHHSAAHPPHRRRLLFLVVWLAAFFVTHAYVVPSAVAVQARYHLHLVVPFCFLAALGMTLVWQRSRAAALILGLVIVAAPITHQEFIVDEQYNELEEVRFVREARHLIGPECQLIEFAPNDADSRFRRAGLVLEGGTYHLPYGLTVLTPDNPELPTLEPGSCTYVYEGLACQANKEPHEERAPVCDLLRSLSLSPISETSIISHIYDNNLAAGFAPGLQRLHFTLYRVR